MYKDIDEAIEYTRRVARLNKNRFWGEVLIYTYTDIDKKIGYSPAECAEEYNQIAELLEELKKLRELKDTYAKGMEASYSEFRYKQGIAEGYSKAENDYFAQSQKDREDTYNCGYAIGRQDAIDEIWKGVVEEYNNDYCSCVDDYMDYQVTLREIDKILRRMKESKG